MSWVSKNLNLGVVQVGKPVNFDFVYQGAKNITGATASCGCTIASWKPKLITGFFTPKRNMASKAKVTKNITATFDDGSTETLTIEAKVIARES